MHDWNSVYSTLAGEIYGIQSRALQAAIDLALDAASPQRISDVLVREGLLSREQDLYISSLTNRLVGGTDGDETADGGNGHNESRYAIRSEHARGGIGRVLIAWDPKLEREVAIKELQGTPPPHVVERFLREARITARLEHPSIIPIYEILTRADGAPYYAMKLVRGTTLRQAIGARSNMRERLALLPHFLNLCQAIAYAHSRAVIHRDIKSNNAMIGEFGETFVIDWGLAKRVSDPDEPESEGLPGSEDAGRDQALTLVGQVIGTPNYMSPEQARGDLDRVDARSDVFALGAVLYEMLSGEPPLSGESRSVVLRRASRGDVVPIEARAPEAPHALIAICRKAMAVDPGRRYASAGELAADVERFQAGLLVQAHRYGPVARALRVVRRHRAVVSTVAVFLVALLLTGALSYVSVQRARERETILEQESEKPRYDNLIVQAQRYLDEGHTDKTVEALNACPPTHRSWEWGRLQRIFNDATHVLPHDGANVRTGAISPDGRLLLTADEVAIYLWNLAAGTKLKSVNTPKTLSIDFHPDGDEFVSSDEQGRAHIWNLETFSVIATLTAHEQNTGVNGQRPTPHVSAVRYTPDGERLLTADTEGRAILRDRKTVEIVNDWHFDRASLQCVAIDPGGNRAACGTRDGRVFVFDLASRAVLVEFEAHASGNTSPDAYSMCGVLDLTFTPIDGILAATGDDGYLTVWNVNTAENVMKVPVHSGDATSVVVPNGSETPVTTGVDGAVNVWDLDTVTDLAPDYHFPFGVNKALITPDRERMVLCTQDGTASVWPFRNRFGEFVLEGHTDEVFALAFSPDNRLLVSGAGHWENRADNRVIVWNVETGEQTFVLRGHESAVFYAAFFPDARRVLTASRDHGIIIWDVVTGRQLKTLQSLQPYLGISSVALSPDGQSFAAAGWNDREGVPCELALWHTDDGTIIRRMEGGAGHLEDLAFSPDGSSIAAATWDGMWNIWDVETGELKRASGDSGQKYQSLTVSPDSRSILTLGVSLPVQLWDAATGELVRELVADHTYMERAVYSPDGKRIVTCNTSAMGIRVIDVETGNVFATHPYPAHNVAFSPDGLLLAAACVDKTVRVWEALPWDRDYDGSYWTDYNARIESHQHQRGTRPSSPDRTGSKN